VKFHTFNFSENTSCAEHLAFLHDCCEQLEDASLMQRVDYALKQLEPACTKKVCIFFFFYKDWNFQIRLMAVFWKQTWAELENKSNSRDI